MIFLDFFFGGLPHRHTWMDPGYRVVISAIFQAEDRAHRMGQKESVNVWELRIC